MKIWGLWISGILHAVNAYRKSSFGLICISGLIVKGRKKGLAAEITRALFGSKRFNRLLRNENRGGQIWLQGPFSGLQFDLTILFTATISVRPNFS